MTADFGRPDLDLLVRARHIPDGEPKFLLRARDPAAAAAVRAWAAAFQSLGGELAVVEQALRQADAMDGWPEKVLPDGHHLQEHERLQLRYALSRRAWRSRPLDTPPVEILLAEQRGWDAAVGKMRHGGLKVVLAGGDGA
jgi:hypothetical protein